MSMTRSNCRIPRSTIPLTIAGNSFASLPKLKMREITAKVENERKHCQMINLLKLQKLSFVYKVRSVVPTRLVLIFPFQHSLFFFKNIHSF